MLATLAQAVLRRKPANVYRRGMKASNGAPNVTVSRRETPLAPPGLWQRPEMAKALAARDLGTVVRVFRKWTGASQTDMSVLLGIPQPHISSLEHGRRRVTSMALFERFAEGLGIPRRLLGLAEKDADEGPESITAGGVGVNYRADETDEAVRASHRAWSRTRRNLNLHRAELTQLVSRLYPPSVRLGATGILAPESWRLPAPVDLAPVRLAWEDSAPAPVITGQHAETLPLRPLVSRGHHYTRYHRAVHDLDRPRLFENRLCHRLLDVSSHASGDAQPLLRLTLGSMCYFDMIDVGEALAHEVTLAGIDDEGTVRGDRVTWEGLLFRRLVRGPFALSRYPLMLSVSTLTIRRSSAGTTFLMLRRSPAKVAIAGGMLSVFPTGVFQPASIIPPPGSPDFDLWRNVMREYSEEYLGNPEHDGDGPPIDYENEEPFRSLEAARRAGKIRVLCLGVGVDALNYVGDVFTVAVFDADVFDAIFEEMVEQNDEGDFVVGHDRQEFTFDEQTIERLMSTQPIAPSGAACLQLAWQHRASIL
jgi:transcriptional regulator with XRE-family HTH domain